jgi:uncharacterized DUF497 family protein
VAWQRYQRAYFIARTHLSRYYLDKLAFEWDERKNLKNRIKHGVWLEEARRVFENPRALLMDDPDHSEQEDRFLLLGMSASRRVLVAVHCYREKKGMLRLISARKATKKERRIYEKGI